MRQAGLKLNSVVPPACLRTRRTLTQSYPHSHSPTVHRSLTMMLRRLAFTPRAARLNTLMTSRRPLSTAPPPQADPVVEAATALAGPETYNKALSLFHWLVGLSIVGSVGAVLQAQNVKGKEKGEWMFRHKSLGLLAGILVAPRFVFRLSSKIPAPMKEWNGFEQIASKITHLSLYGLMIGMPVSGIAMGYYGGKGLPFFWTTLDGAKTANGEIAKQAFSIHKTMGTYGKYLIPLHVGAAGAHAVRGHAIFARINPFR